MADVTSTQGTPAAATDKPPAERKVRQGSDFQPVVDAIAALIDALAGFATSWLGRSILVLYCLWPLFGGQQLATWMTALGVDGIVGFLRGFATGMGNLGGG